MPWRSSTWRLAWPVIISGMGTDSLSGTWRSRTSSTVSNPSSRLAPITSASRWGTTPMARKAGRGWSKVAPPSKQSRAATAGVDTPICASPSPTARKSS